MLRCPSKCPSRKLHCFENPRGKTKQTKQEILHFFNHLLKLCWGLRPTRQGALFVLEVGRSFIMPGLTTPSHGKSLPLKPQLGHPFICHPEPPPLHLSEPPPAAPVEECWLGLSRARSHPVRPWGLGEEGETQEAGSPRLTGQAAAKGHPLSGQPRPGRESRSPVLGAGQAATTVGTGKACTPSACPAAAHGRPPGPA